MKYKDLTEIQTKILNYIMKVVTERNYPPTVREICNEVGLKSTSSVHAHLNTLEIMGYIKRDSGKSSKARTIEVTDTRYSDFRKNIENLPVINRYLLKNRFIKDDNIEAYFPIPKEYLPDDYCFIMKMNGNYLNKDGIFNDDKLMIMSANSCKNGDIAVVILNNGTILNARRSNGTSFNLRVDDNINTAPPENKNKNSGNFIIDSLLILKYCNESGIAILKSNSSDFNIEVTDNYQIIGKVFGSIRFY